MVLVLSFLLITFFTSNIVWGQAGNAINFQNSDFDSHGDFIYCGQPDFGFTDKLTVTAWIKWTTDPSTWAVSNHGEREGYYSTYIAYATHNTLDVTSEHGLFWLRNSKTANKIYFTVETVNGTVTAISNTSPVINTWYFLAGTYDGSTVKLYINGTLADSESLTGNIRANTDCRLNMGRLPWGYGLFVGYLDEVRIWDIALTQSEIQSQQTSKSTIQDSDCLSYWNFDVGSGTTITDSKGLASGTFYTALVDVHGDNTDLANKIIEDADKSFVTDAWNGKTMITVAGAGVDETNVVVSNTNNVFTLTYGFAGSDPDNRTTPVIDDNTNMTWFGILDDSESSQWVSSSDLSLPVSLSDFNAEIVSNKVKLNWITEAEIDNKGFILDRSQDNESWVTIASYLTNIGLNGQGNCSNQTIYSYLDKDVIPGEKYYYRLKDVNSQGKITEHSPISIQLNKLSEISTAMMNNAYPNPFNPSTSIKYNLKENANLKISVFDLKGNLVNTLFHGYQSTGEYNTYWHGTDEMGVQVPSGIYIIRMQAGNTKQIQKVMLLR